MADGEQHIANLTESVQRARTLALAHPSLERVGDPIPTGNGFQLEVLIEVPMPNTWRAEGASPSGVQRFEPVRIEFPPQYPLDSPEISLRPDFRRDIAHIQPWLTSDSRPVPCIQDGQMSEFMQQQGIPGILNQTVSWLEHAAEGRLIDPDQGWEPQRRDAVKDTVVADSDGLRSLVDRRGGYRFQKIEYFRRESKDKAWLHGKILDEQVPLNKKTIKDAVQDRETTDGYRWGRSLALIVWPGKKPSGKPIICDVYTPDIVNDLGALETKAREFGCVQGLKNALAQLTRSVEDYDPAGPFPLIIVLCARRPFNLIGSSSPIELCFYVIDFHAADAFPKGNETPVRPASQRDQITPALLAKLSVVDPAQNRSLWTLIGAGSLGSKIALHMAKAGRGPAAIIDPAMMAPHNFARHALVPQTGDMQIMSMDTKACQLHGILAGLSQEAVAITEDVVHVLNTRALAKQAWSKDTWAILNTTASLRTRAALCAATLPHRVIEAVLYAQGQLGVIATEGTTRNPNLGDLVTEFYAVGVADALIRPLLYPANDRDDLVRVVIGEGCGSTTMQVSDGRLSMFAAGAAEYVLSRQVEGLPENGELLVGRLDEAGIGVCWDRLAVAPVTVVRAENGAQWTVRINARALEKMEAEVARWPDVETGGVLLGRQDEVTKCFHIVDVLPAPEDSRRSPTEFILGTKGLRKALEEYARSTNVALYCLGTWHSHLSPSGPSGLDYQTARAIGVARLAPSVLLIHTPTGYRGVLADQGTEKGGQA